MTYLIAGLILFFALHAVPSIAPLKNGLLARLGTIGYRALFSVVSASSLGLIVYGFATSPTVDLWIAPTFAMHLAYVVVPLAFVLLVSGLLRGNVLRLTRHPMLWAVGLWASVHLLNNGDIASVMLFGGFLVFIVLVAHSIRKRPPKPAPAKAPIWRDILGVVLGLAIAYAIAYFHADLFGVAVLP